VVTSKVLEFCFIVSGSDRMAGRQRGRGGQKDSYNTTTTVPPQKFLEELFGYRWGGQKIADCRLPRAGRIRHYCASFPRSRNTDLW